MGCSCSATPSPPEELNAIWVHLGDSIYRRVDPDALFDEYTEFAARLEGICDKFKDAPMKVLVKQFGLKNAKTGKRIVKGVYWDLFCDRLVVHAFYADAVLEHIKSQVSRAKDRLEYFKNLKGNQATEETKLMNEYVQEGNALLGRWIALKERLEKLFDARGLMHTTTRSRRESYMAAGIPGSKTPSKSPVVSPSRSPIRRRSIMVWQK
mmetsp:Transcript_15818/g.32185  ORF Transcript_15818/g.32185 Transcript_15818/m.32185 type:complete len:209 (-) Transcript_15818:513-1139(-)